MKFSKFMSIREDASRNPRLDKIGWLSPDGVFHPLRCNNDTHGALICMLLDGEIEYDTTREAYNQGWVRIIPAVGLPYSGKKTLAASNYGTHELTSAQMTTLKDMAIKHGYDRIKFDNWKDYRTVWSEIEESSDNDFPGSLERRALEQFDVVDRVDDAEYILSDGTCLAVNDDHRIINSVFVGDVPEGYYNSSGSGSGYMLAFMGETGAVRTRKSSENRLGISYVQMPTARQIDKILNTNARKLFIDQLSPMYDLVASMGFSLPDEKYEAEAFMRGEEIDRMDESTSSPKLIRSKNATGSFSAWLIPGANAVVMFPYAFHWRFMSGVMDARVKDRPFRLPTANPNPFAEFTEDDCKEIDGIISSIDASLFDPVIEAKSKDGNINILMNDIFYKLGWIRLNFSKSSRNCTIANSASVLSNADLRTAALFLKRQTAGHIPPNGLEVSVENKEVFTSFMMSEVDSFLAGIGRTADTARSRMFGGANAFIGGDDRMDESFRDFILRKIPQTT